MKLLLLVVLLGAGCAAVSPQACCRPAQTEIADVKTCGCPKSASCGDCCGPQHCKCAPS